MKEIIYAYENRVDVDGIIILNRIDDGIDNLVKEMMKEVGTVIDARAEAIKDFAERLKNTNSTMDKRIISVERIDNLVKEMTKEKE